MHDGAMAQLLHSVTEETATNSKGNYDWFAAAQ